MSETKKFYETDEFKKINEEWQMKLTESGFDDLEKQDKHFIQPQSFYPASKTKKSPEYYQLMQLIADTHAFNRTVDKVIMQLHADGKSLRQIASSLREMNETPLKKSAIQDVIKKSILSYTSNL